MSDEKGGMTVMGGRFLGFFSLMLLLTLNHESNGKDLLDGLIELTHAKAEVLNMEAKHIKLDKP